MSEVEGVQAVEDVKKADSADETNSANMATARTPAVALVAPTLRVEQIRDEHKGVSEDEVASHGEGSDIEGGGKGMNDIEFQPPDDDLKDRIIKQVEFYFSDANILKDAFLLKHVRRNKQGYVSLKLITSFKRVKTLTKDYRVVAYSLRDSEKLEVNEEGTKVRRKDALPDHDETTPSRTIVAVNLPMENPSIETVAELFSKCGDIALIRILKPGKSIPSDVKKHISKHPEIGNITCAVVEFEQYDSAKKACETLNTTDDWRSGMRVVLLSVKKDKHKEVDKNNFALKKSENLGTGDRSDGADLSPGSATEESMDKKKRRRGNRKKRNSRVEELAQDSSCYSSASETEGAEPSPSNQKPQTYSGGSPACSGRKSLSPKSDTVLLSPSSTPGSSPRSSPRGSPTSRRRNNPHGKSPLVDGSRHDRDKHSPKPSPHGSPEPPRQRKDSSGTESGSSPSSPWVQRRLKAQEKSPLAASPAGSPRPGRRGMADMEGVLRQPRGPDGTKGFYGGKGRGKPSATDVVVATA